MKITPDEVRRVATLACLEFDEDGETRMAVEMSRILDYVDQIRGAALPSVSDDADSIPMPGRADEPGVSLAVSDVERAAPRFAHGHFVVPKVIGGE